MASCGAAILGGARVETLCSLPLARRKAPRRGFTGQARPPRGQPPNQWPRLHSRQRLSASRLRARPRTELPACARPHVLDPHVLDPSWHPGYACLFSSPAGNVASKRYATPFGITISNAGGWKIYVLETARCATLSASLLRVLITASEIYRFSDTCSSLRHHGFERLQR